MQSYLDESLKKLEEFEGSIPWMYRDTVGKVTVGVGLMLPDAAAACRLPFGKSGVAATEAQIRDEFARVDGLPMGRAALFYRAAGKPELAQAEIDQLLRTVLVGFEGKLREALPGYDDLPDGVKLALLDMIYNLGPAGLVRGFPKMLAAVEEKDWARAAACCERRGPGAARNAWTRQMLLSNVAGSMKAVAESEWKRFGYGMVGMGAAVLGWMRRKRSFSRGQDGAARMARIRRIRLTGDDDCGG